MRVELAYGRHGTAVEVPDRAEVIVPVDEPGLTDEAASAGAALLAGKALGLGLTLDQIDPVAAVIQPTPTSVELYRSLRPQVDHVAEAVLAATESLPGTSPFAT